MYLRLPLPDALPPSFQMPPPLKDLLLRHSDSDLKLLQLHSAWLRFPPSSCDNLKSFCVCRFIIHVHACTYWHTWYEVPYLQVYSSAKNMVNAQKIWDKWIKINVDKWHFSSYHSSSLSSTSHTHQTTKGKKKIELLFSLDFLKKALCIMSRLDQENVLENICIFSRGKVSTSWRYCESTASELFRNYNTRT